MGVRPLTEKQPDIDPLAKEERDLALSKIVPQYRPLFTCLAWTGARPNELFALRWKDIDSRIVPMPSTVKQALEQQKQISTASLDGYIFTTKNGQPIDKHLDHV